MSRATRDRDRFLIAIVVALVVGFPFCALRAASIRGYVYEDSANKKPAVGAFVQGAAEAIGTEIPMAPVQPDGSYTLDVKSAQNVTLQAVMPTDGRQSLPSQVTVRMDPTVQNLVLGPLKTAGTEQWVQFGMQTADAARVTPDALNELAKAGVPPSGILAFAQGVFSRGHQPAEWSPLAESVKPSSVRVVKKVEENLASGHPLPTTADLARSQIDVSPETYGRIVGFGLASAPQDKKKSWEEAVASLPKESKAHAQVAEGVFREGIFSGRARGL